MIQASMAYTSNTNSSLFITRAEGWRVLLNEDISETLVAQMLMLGARWESWEDGMLLQAPRSGRTTVSSVIYKKAGSMLVHTRRYNEILEENGCEDSKSSS